MVYSYKKYCALGWYILTKFKMLCCFFGVLGFILFAQHTALAKIPDNQGAFLEIKGNGLPSNAPVSLVVGKKQTITTTSDRRGNFAFSKLQYFSFVPLDFHLVFPGAVSEHYKIQNSVIDLQYNPLAATIRVRGKISPGGNVSIDINGEDRAFQLAGPQGDVFVFSSLGKNIAGGNSYINAQIINVAQTCCPALVVPADPINFTIASMGLTPTNNQLSPPIKSPNPQQNHIKPKGETQKQNKATLPNSEQAPVKAPTKSKAPYLILSKGAWVGKEIELPVLHMAAEVENPSQQIADPTSQSLSSDDLSGGAGSLSSPGGLTFGDTTTNPSLPAANSTLDSTDLSGGGLNLMSGGTPSISGVSGAGAGGGPSLTAATSSDAAYDASYVGGVKSTTDKIRDVFETRILMLGAFIDGRVMNNSLADLQSLNARTYKDYYPSLALCRFGTLPRSLAATESRMPANRQVIANMIMSNNLQSKTTIFEKPNTTVDTYTQNVNKDYCKQGDGNGGLRVVCNATDVDLQWADMDFTGILGIPMTTGVDFINNGETTPEKRLASLIQALTFYRPIDQQNIPVETLNDEGKKKYYNNIPNFVDSRHVAGVRQISADSIGSLVALKAEGTSGSANHMKAVLMQLGLSAADAKKLIGDKPSYFAQMDILTKKIYQDPVFFANLYESPANIDRQRVAMLAISLMQERDLLETLRRKELLLSGYLTLKLDQAQSKLSTSIKAR